MDLSRKEVLPSLDDRIQLTLTYIRSMCCCPTLGFIFEAVVVKMRQKSTSKYRNNQHCGTAGTDFKITLLVYQSQYYQQFSNREMKDHRQFHLQKLMAYVRGVNNPFLKFKVILTPPLGPKTILNLSQ